MRHFPLVLRVIALAGIPLSLAFFVYVYVVDAGRFVYLLREDGWIEWLTFGCLLMGGLVFLETAIRIRRQRGYYHWFYLALGMICLVGAFEEISWAQRVLGLESPDYFLSLSDQQEINLHNVLQQQLDFKTKHVVAYGLFVYGVVLSVLAQSGRIRRLLSRLGIIAPPLFLLPGFFISAALMLDIPTGFEEELGEFTFSLCLLLFAAFELWMRAEATQVAVLPVGIGAMTRLRTHRGQQAWVIAVTALAGGIRLWQLNRQGLQLPEAVYAWAAHAQPVWIVQQAWQQGSPVSPALSLVLFAWTSLFGEGEIALRLPGALAGAASVPVLWQLLRLTHPQQVAMRMVVTVLFAVSPLPVFQSQDVSPHAFITFFALLSVCCTVQLARRPAWPVAVGLIVVNQLMLTFHLYSVTLIVAEAVFLAAYFSAAYFSAVPARRMSPPGARGWRTAVAAMGFSLLPALLWAFLARDLWPGSQSLSEVLRMEWALWSDRLGEVWRLATVGDVVRLPHQIAYELWLLVPLGLGLVALRAEDGVRSGEMDAAPDRSIRWFVVGAIVLPLVPALFAVPQLTGAAIALSGPFILILIGLGLIYPWRWVRLIGLAGLVVALVIMLTGLHAYFTGTAKSQYREMAQRLTRHAEDDDGVVLLAPEQRFLADYYLRDRLVLHPLPESEPLAQVAQIVPEEVDGLLQGYLAQHPFLWLALYNDKRVDPNSFTRNYLTAVAYWELCWEWQDVELCRFASPNFTTPAIERPIQIAYAGGLLLEKAVLSLPDRSLREDLAVLLELDWQASERPTLDHKVSVRLVDGQGTVLVQRDDLPNGPLLPPTTWAAGDRKVGYLALLLPSDLPDGDFPIQLLVYDPVSLAPVPVAVDGAAPAQPFTLAIVHVDGDEVWLSW